MHWQQGDAVWIGGATYTAESGGSTTTTLTGTGAEKESGSDLYKAYYPASLCQTNGSSMTLTLPAVQDYSEPVGGKLVADQFPMYAQSSGTDLTFHNLCAVLAVPLKGTHTVKEVVVSSGNTGPWLSGPFNVVADGDGFKAVITGGTGSSRTVTLDCGTAGVTLSATVETIFCIALPEASYEPGSLVVEAKDADGNVLARHTNASRATASLLECSKIYQPEALVTKIAPYFTVSAGKRVRFAPGNVVFEANYGTAMAGQEPGGTAPLTGVWKFTDNQWDYWTEETIGADGIYHYDHFGWATAGVRNTNGDYGADETHVHYQPWSIRIVRYDGNNIWRYGPYYDGETWSKDDNIPYGLVPENSWRGTSVERFCDWGVHFDEEGNERAVPAAIDNTNRFWYTLSAYEWKYLFESRLNANQLRGYTEIEMNGSRVKGFVILPDNWVCPAGCVFSSNSGNTDPNHYGVGSTSGSSGSWEEMEAAGAVFLPAASGRIWEYVYPTYDDPLFNDGHGSGSTGNLGVYWSSSAICPAGYFTDSDIYSLDDAAYLSFSNGYTPVSGVDGTYRYNVLTVRLVQDY